MYLEEIVETCPELFIEIIRLINDIQGIDLLSLMLVNKKWFDLIDNYSNQILYKLLSEDRLQKDYFKILINENNNNYKNIFINNVLTFWSECLQTSKPLTQLLEYRCGDVINKCQGRKCWLSGNLMDYDDFSKSTYRHIRSKNPITKDITMYFYVNHLNKCLNHSKESYLLIGIMNEAIFNGIVGNQAKATYVGEVKKREYQARNNTTKKVTVIDSNNNTLHFNTSYASNGYICGTKEKSSLASCVKKVWEKGDVIGIKVSGIEERKISISYYLNDELIFELKNALDGVDVVNVKENRLYFDANILQVENNINNTVIVASFTKPNINIL